MKLKIQNKFTEKLPADPITENYVRQVAGACFSYVTPEKPSNPKVIHVAEEVLELIGLVSKDVTSEAFLSVFSGTSIYPETKPFAMAYAGHQFGNWAGQLGDGRAINLFEVTHNNHSWMLQLKGVGKTPYSRRGDGFAVLRSCIREHLCSETMFHLGVPTTRSLCLLTTGDSVLRDVLYNGNAAYEPGAIVCRVAPSFIRFGNFELLAARNDFENLKLLTDFTIQNHFPEITLEGKAKYLAFFESVSQKTLEMIVHWQRVGFVHGVMNTDNMSVHGLTIDYGPYGWQDDYNPDWTPNTTDSENRRYRFGQQANVALWNLMQLANAIFPLIDEAEPLEAVLNNFSVQYHKKFNKMMLDKIGIEEENEATIALVKALEENLVLQETDMTIFFRNLAQVDKNETEIMAFDRIKSAFYTLEEMTERNESTWLFWFTQYLSQLKASTTPNEERKQKMNAVNPKYVLRNYMAQLAIEAAEKEDYRLISELYEILKNPYDEQPDSEKWFAKRPDWARTKVGCSMLSCSS